MVGANSHNTEMAPQGGAVPADARGTSRTPLPAMRSAKLVCESGEYVCLVRDVSASGVNLGLLNDLPALPHAFLELNNGEVYPMLGVWRGERQASFRFTHPIDPAELMAEPGCLPRRSLRLAIRKPGMVFAEGMLTSMMLRDLAQNGASFESDTRFPLGQTIVLSLEAIPEVTAWVRWRKGRHYGVMFETALRLDQLAAYALALQPITPSGERKAIARVA